METNNKLREALTRVKKIAAAYINCHDDEIDRVATEIVATCDSDLAEPMRNYEVGTVEEQAKRFAEYCESEVCRRKRCKSRAKALCIEHCALEWAQLPYEKGVPNAE